VHRKDLEMRQSCVKQEHVPGGDAHNRKRNLTSSVALDKAPQLKAAQRKEQRCLATSTPCPLCFRLTEEALQKSAPCCSGNKFLPSPLEYNRQRNETPNSAFQASKRQNKGERVKKVLSEKSNLHTRERRLHARRPSAVRELVHVYPIGAKFFPDH